MHSKRVCYWPQNWLMLNVVSLGDVNNLEKHYSLQKCLDKNLPSMQKLNKKDTQRVEFSNLAPFS